MVTTTKQHDMDGTQVSEGVDTEEKTTVSFVFTDTHFMLRISATALDKIIDMDDLPKRRERLEKKIRPRPYVEVIPAGAKKEQTEALIAAALETNTRGKT